MSFQECLVLIAYLNFLTVPKTKHENRTSVKTDVLPKPHRVEKVGRSTTRSRPKLKELLAQESVCADQCENVKAGKLKPHRVEKVGRSTTRSRPKLKELLAQESVCADQCENVKAGKLKPHRVEKAGRSTTRSRLKLKELLVDTRENGGSDESNEWDTGPAVGNEIW